MFTDLPNLIFKARETVNTNNFFIWPYVMQLQRVAEKALRTHAICGMFGFRIR